MSDIRHEFVSEIPRHIEPATVYVSIEYTTAVHLCACGCGNEVVTPLSPRDWNLTFNGDTVSLAPSIGNWGLNCRAHYWIRDDTVVWAPTVEPIAAHPTTKSSWMERARSWTAQQLARLRARR